MAKVTIEFDTEYPHQVKEVYIMLARLMQYHYPKKTDENSTPDSELS